MERIAPGLYSNIPTPDSLADLERRIQELEVEWQGQESERHSPESPSTSEADRTGSLTTDKS